MRARAFSLMEVVVALTVNAIVLTVAVGLFALVTKRTAEAQRRSELERDAVLASEVMERELRVAGVGVPAKKNLTTGLFLTPVLVATPTAVGILADLPRPDGQAPALGLLSTALSKEGLSPPNTHVWWFTENNGPCQPDGSTGSGPSCTTAEASTFFPGVEGCGVRGTANDRTCPWGSRRMLAGEPFQVVYGDGTWTTAAMASPISLHGGPAHPHDLMFVETSALANWDVDATVVDPGSFPRAQSGNGFVVTLDRVFFELRGTTLTRMQCWGEPAPERVEWPVLQTAPSGGKTATLPTTASYTTPTATSVCTAREVLARNVAALNFSYVDGDGLATVDPTLVAGITYTLTLAVGDVRHTVAGGVTLRNRSRA